MLACSGGLQARLMTLGRASPSAEVKLGQGRLENAARGGAEREEEQRGWEREK